MIPGRLPACTLTNDGMGFCQRNAWRVKPSVSVCLTVKGIYLASPVREERG